MRMNWLRKSFAVFAKTVDRLAAIEKIWSRPLKLVAFIECSAGLIINNFAVFKKVQANTISLKARSSYNLLFFFLYDYHLVLYYHDTSDFRNYFIGIRKAETGVSNVIPHLSLRCWVLQLWIIVVWGQTRFFLLFETLDSLFHLLRSFTHVVALVATFQSLSSSETYCLSVARFLSVEYHWFIYSLCYDRYCCYSPFYVYYSGL